jgi:hypothetical protein
MAVAEKSAPTSYPPADPRSAIAQAYRFERARRTLRLQHRDERRRASRRFWLTLLGLIAAVAAIGGAIVYELQRLFGI